MLHNRRSIRLKGYDYSQKGIYFITLCCQDKQHFFGEIQNGNMILNELGEIIKEEWEKTPLIRTNISLGAYIIMPDHFHAILHIDQQITNKEDYTPNQFKSPSQTIGAIIRGFKGATTIRIKKFNSNSTGESQFAPTTQSAPTKQFAPTTQFPPTTPTQFAPTNNNPIPSESKFASTTQFTPTKIWQRNYFEKIVRDQRAYDNITQYIIDNPKKWEEKKLTQNRY